MSKGWRQGRLFAAGLLAGALAVWAYMAWFIPPSAPVATASLPQPGATDAAEQQSAAPEPAVQAPAVAAAVPAGCPTEPLLPASGERDGQFNLQAAPAAGSGIEPSAFLKVAEEAAGEGRPRDAEVALLVACRLTGAGAPLADVKSHLGQHYAALGAQPRFAGQRAALMQRAGELFGDSARTYASALGANASKTRLASQRQAAVEQALARGEAVAAGTLDERTVLGAAADSAAAARGEEAVAGEVPVAPGCADAGSPAQRAVCSDPELAQMERDLDRLRQQARAVTRDPGGFAQRQEQAWAQRENQCRGDKACLQRWYAQRKKQLFSEF